MSKSEGKLAQEEQTAEKIEQSMPKLLEQAVKNAGSAARGKGATTARSRTTTKSASSAVDDGGESAMAATGQ